MTTRKSGSTTRRTSASRTRKPATIDLEAKKSTASTADTKASAAKTETKSASASKPSASSTSAKVAAKDTSKPVETGKQTPPLGRSGAKPQEKSAEKPIPEAKGAPAASKNANGGNTGFVPMLVSGLVGGVSVAALLAGLQIGGVLNGFGNGTTAPATGGVTLEQYEALKAEIAELSQTGSDDRIAAIETAISDLKSTPAETDQDLVDQVTGLETEIASLKSVLENLASTDGGEVPDATQLTAALAQAGQRIDKMETTLSDMLASGNEGIAETGQRLDELAQKIDGMAGASDEKIAPLVSDIETVKSSLEELGNKVTENSAGFEKLQSDASQLQQSIASVKASEKVARSVAVNALGSALKNDDSLVLAIASLESLGAKSAETARLSELAASGIPTLSELLSELEAVTNTIQNPVQASDGGTLSEKFWANARNLVTFRSSGPQEGDSAIAILSRVKAGVELGQLQSSLNEWRQLPMEIQATGKDWSAKLEKRIEAFALYRELSDKLQNEAS